ncbi:uroporphyrinogen-III synthase [Bradyrhizobium sp. AUGA SZCCT0431]|uniref:uroporphyrinogen-III synthase n=1 Tax=Bradyrhizobium sp. AUGA SZCCT0431 TaxID=2807674 RepID=UPI001BAAF7FF|nr:uroporphyrinogen-III synthase [Bradyrhizobium sp. AUGA SZCCT0431]MBR1141925.1 uroporphyrinogen-III synthase [Bradyrhizobium sp. AUGA SZCCT0431]
MAVLVTRPHPDDEATATALRARGFEVLRAPMLRFEAVPFHDDAVARYGAIIVTSANALRAIAPHLADSRLLKLPLFAVGEHTASAARDAGFSEVIAARGDAGALRDLVLGAVKSKQLKKASTLLYLAGADLARDLAGELGEKGFTVVTHTTYRMIPASSLPQEICDAFVANQVEAVLHYSRRSARAFLNAARSGGVEISALALPQCCISAAVAAVLRDAGATQVTAAAQADENALFEALSRALRTRLA